MWHRRKLRFWNGMWEFGPLSFILRKKNKKPFLICLPKFPSSLQFFEQFAVHERRADFCKVPNCQYHLLIHDELMDLSSFNVDLNCDSSYQSVDWSFTTFKHYFICFIQVQGFMFQKFLSAFNFNRFFNYRVWKNLSLTKKRLLRKDFRTKQDLGRQNELPLSRSDPPADLSLKIISIPKLEKRQKLSRHPNFKWKFFSLTSCVVFVFHLRDVPLDCQNALLPQTLLRHPLVKTFLSLTPVKKLIMIIPLCSMQLLSKNLVVMVSLIRQNIKHRSFFKKPEKIAKTLPVFYRVISMMFSRLCKWTYNFIPLALMKNRT